MNAAFLVALGLAAAAAAAALWAWPALRARRRRLQAPLTWNNLGLWPAGTHDDACRAMLRRAASLAGLPTARAVSVLDVGCGAGASCAELRRWGAPRGTVVGVDAAAQDPASGVLRASATRLPARLRGSADVVVALDCAYHFAPSRAAFFREARRALRGGEGAVLVLADLVLRRAPPSLAGRALLRAAAAVCGVPYANAAMDEAAYRAALEGAGFDGAGAVFERATDEVLGGFARHVRASGGSTKYRVTAALAERLQGTLDFCFVRARPKRREERAGGDDRMVHGAGGRARGHK